MAVENLVFQIGITLLVSMLLGALFAKLKQSEIIGYLLGGILLGPYVLGFIKQTDTDVLTLFSELGVLMLLFFIGLELDVKKFKEGGFYALVLGPAKIITCFGFGFLLGGFFGFEFLEKILLGLIVSFTSTAIIGKYLIEKRMMDRLEAKIAIPMLLIEDFVAVVALALLSGYGGSVDKVFLNGVFLLIFALFVIGRFSNYLIKLMEKLDYESHITLYSLGIALAMAYLAGFFGLSTAIGAFLGGFLLSGLGHVEKIKKELGSFRDFFAAFFFVGIGLHFVPTSWSIVWMGLLVLLVYIIAQYFAYGFFGTLLGLGSHFSVRLASLMIAIGEFSLIIAGLAVYLKTPHAQDLLGLAVFLGLVSTLAMSFLLRYSEIIANFFSFLIPDFIENPFREVRKKAYELIRVPLRNKSIQNEVFEHLKLIALNSFIILSVWYVLFYIISETRINLFEGYSNALVFSIFGLVLVSKPLVDLFKEIRNVIFSVVKFASRDVFSKYGLEQLIRIEESITEIFISFFMFVLSIVFFATGIYLNSLFLFAGLVLFFLSILLTLNGVRVVWRERRKVRKGLKATRDDLF